MWLFQPHVPLHPPFLSPHPTLMPPQLTHPTALPPTPAPCCPNLTLTTLQKPSLRDKFFWSGMALLLYLVASQVPLYGIVVAAQGDAYYIMRMIMASNRHTLMELGVSPIITSGMIMSLLMGAKIIDVDLSKEKDQKLVNIAQTVIGMLITLGSALAFVLGGNYGAVAVLGTFKCVLLVAQLVFAGLVVLLLDDLLGKGYGLGSGLNLFIVTNVCENIVWACLSPLTITAGSGPQFEGAFTNFFYVLVKLPWSSDRGRMLFDAFFRSDFPNLSNVLATVLVFVAVVFVQGWTNSTLGFAPDEREYKAENKNIDRYVGADKPPRWPRAFPIKLFYTSNMPIMLLSALTSSLYFFSQITYKKYAKNAFIRLLGIWEETPGRGYRPVWGLAYLLSPPKNLVVALLEPVHTLFYFAFMIITCALLAGAWCEIMAQQSPGAVAEQFKEHTEGGQKKRLYIYTQEKGSLWTKNAGYKELKDKIRTAAALGGMALACLSVSADLLGAIGSGSGVLMAVTIICDMFSKAAKEHPGE